MRTVIRSLAAIGLLAVGYGLGTSQALSLAVLSAQEAKDEAKPGAQDPAKPGAPQKPKEASQLQSDLPEEVADRVKEAAEGVDTAMQALMKQQFYVPAIQGMNSFAVTAGGLNAVEDLKAGRGVDPETFAGLYAGLATDDVAPELSTDEEGRLMYKDKLIRLYPKSRLKQMFAERAKFAGEETKETIKSP